MTNNILLDTCALVWFLADDSQLGSTARAAIVDTATAKYISL
jgi:PIN domain nuclease of toxin-antitoxin system